MKKTALLIFLFLTVFIVKSQDNTIRKLYVGTFTSEGAEGIYLCNFNQETGEIRLDKTFKGIDNPSFLKISPDGKYLYVATRAANVIEPSGGFVSAYKIGTDGSIYFLNKQVSNGQDPCHVDVSPDGKFVAVANYGSGTTSLFPVEANGSLAPASSVIANEGSGPDVQRQSSPHAHSIKFEASGKLVFSADLGTDQLNIFRLEGKELKPAGQKFVKLAPGAGPRHFVFHPDNEIIYVINELNSTITVLKDQGNEWIAVQNISTLTPGFSGKSYCADIHISPNGKYLYGSNRGDNSIFVAAIDRLTKQLSGVGTVKVEGDWPRNFVISDNGRFLLVANQRSGNITVFKIHSETGVPEFTGNEIKLPAPVCLEFL
jgi:6-phosphogluconolactonase